ncbi:hypothetical protein CMQ_2505 [Grosmannia clavigera kw1407]|uniref:Uncharacterized protein n=1 Tax=Grosmannia clavigera (strain kw1407 / UAMH 11150) TaxID=655863 RepID=F0XH65_GROCL|nr:uncharacterized protein CMQ_2505 [Grosmannia clavigera kw1407]EFX02576.1 hypothetical protein CMQ_2505 [Grosmannia clavigera kw1407]
MSGDSAKTVRSLTPSPIVQPAGRPLASQHHKSAAAAAALTPIDAATTEAGWRLETPVAACPRSPASASATTDASEPWTPTRTRSNSSSNYLPLSTFPSSTSPVPSRDYQPPGLSAGEKTKDPLLALPPPLSRAHDQDQERSWGRMGPQASGSQIGAGSQTREHVSGEYLSDKVEGAASTVIVVAADNHDNSPSCDHDHDGPAKTVDSHDLAWDQTRLRIAYLVSTMVSPPGDVATNDSYEELSDRNASPDRIASAATDAAVTAATPLPDRATVRRDPSPKIDIDPCPGGWPGLELLKKRRRITQIQRWCGEIAALGNSRTYCACSVGCAVPQGDGPFEECATPEYTLQDDPDADVAVESIHVPPASPSAASHLSLSISYSVPPSPTPSLPTPAPVAASAHSSSRCDGCGHRLTPSRPFDFVGDAGLLKGSRHTPDSSAAQGLRKALRGIRGLVSRKKEPAESRDEKKELSMQQQRQQREWDRNLSRMRPWDQWHELNCRHTSGEFFTRTTMYGGSASGSSPTESHRPALARRNTTAPGHNPSYDQRHGATSARIDELNSDNISSSSVSDSGNADSQELERRRQREMDARLQRAQRLLASESDGRKAVASGQAPQLPPLLITGEAFCL